MKLKKLLLIDCFVFDAVTAIFRKSLKRTPESLRKNKFR